MYDELVEKLRAQARLERYYHTTGKTLDEAADAIDELQSRIKEDQHLIFLQQEKLLEFAPYQWIPMTERLPEERINPRTGEFEYVLCVTIWGDVRPFVYGTPKGQEEAHFWNGASYVDAYVTHWMPLPEPPKEE